MGPEFKIRVYGAVGHSHAPGFEDYRSTPDTEHLPIGQNGDVVIVRVRDGVVYDPPLVVPAGKEVRWRRDERGRISIAED